MPSVLEATVARVRKSIDRAEADQLDRFVRRYYEHVSPEDVVAGSDVELAGAALAYRSLMRDRGPARSTCTSTRPIRRSTLGMSPTPSSRPSPTTAVPRRLGLDGAHASPERDPLRYPADRLVENVKMSYSESADPEMAATTFGRHQK